MRRFQPVQQLDEQAIQGLLLFARSKNRPLLTWGVTMLGLLGVLANGWQVSGIFTAQSGTPLQISMDGRDSREVWTTASTVQGALALALRQGLGAGVPIVVADPAPGRPRRNTCRSNRAPRFPTRRRVRRSPAS